jgi:aspartate carbamoyltransferase catalytic subunit
MHELRHLTDISSLPDGVFTTLLDRSLDYRRLMEARGPFPQVLEGFAQVNVFYETSTRTTLSFELAAKRLGAIVAVLPAGISSIQKGETVGDTALTLAAQGTDIIVIRATEPGTITTAIEAVEQDGYPTAIVNAGEGALGHPTQGLLDVATVLRAFDRPAADGLADKVLTICGDIRHSRVAASAIEAFGRLGTTIRLAGPAEFLPESRPAHVAQMTEDMDEGLGGADLVMALRVQRERMGRGEALDPDIFHARYGLTHDRLAAARPEALVLHPGPANRGVEISVELADDLSRSLIRSQVTQGVALRMAVLEAIAKGRA